MVREAVWAGEDGGIGRDVDEATCAREECFACGDRGEGCVVIQELSLNVIMRGGSGGCVGEELSAVAVRSAAIGLTQETRSFGVK